MASTLGQLLRALARADQDQGRLQRQGCEGLTGQPGGAVVAGGGDDGDAAAEMAQRGPEVVGEITGSPPLCATTGSPRGGAAFVEIAHRPDPTGTSGGPVRFPGGRYGVPAGPRRPRSGAGAPRGADDLVEPPVVGRVPHGGMEPVEVVVAVGGVVVEQAQPARTRLPGHQGGVLHGAVAPVRLCANSAGVYWASWITRSAPSHSSSTVSGTTSSPSGAW